MAFKNLLEVITFFSDKTVATEYLIKARWHDKITCPHCKSENVNKLSGKTPAFKCYGCRKLFSATKGTIFENSPIPLQKWFAAIYLITSHKKGISSHQLAKDISITQKSAWFVLHRVRFALQSGTFEHLAEDIIQIDETYVGGSETNKHKSAYSRRLKVKQAKLAKEMGLPKPKGKTGTGDKTPVVGMLIQGGKVIAQKVTDTGGKTLIPFIQKNIKTSATIVTDSHFGYKRLESKGYNHKTVNHQIGQYVLDGYHTNGIENFWSIFKRGIIGIYHQISDKHLDKYIDEFEFRFNTRLFGEAERFANMLSLCNQRLTYNELIADV